MKTTTLTMAPGRPEFYNALSYSYKPVVKFCKLTESAIIPSKQTDGAACWDIYSDEDVWLKPQDTETVSTGVGIEIPPNHVGLVCSRSGLAAKDSVFVLNAPGVIDEDYRGELKVILHNATQEDEYAIEYFFYKKGSRIAQLMVVPLPQIGSIEVARLSTTKRGDAGLGSTGV